MDVFTRLGESALHLRHSLEMSKDTAKVPSVAQLQQGEVARPIMGRPQKVVGKLLAQHMLAGRVVNLAAVFVKIAFAVLIDNFVESRKERDPETSFNVPTGFFWGREMRRTVLLDEASQSRARPCRLSPDCGS